MESSARLEKAPLNAAVHLVSVVQRGEEAGLGWATEGTLTDEGI